MEVATVEKEGVILNLEKPSGITSFDVIRYVRKVTGIKKVGHAGTLDPMARGVLIVLVGRGATKRFQEFMTLSKTYVAVIRLGILTETHDLEGRIIEQIPASVDTEQLQKVLSDFTGSIEQIPPMYSAKKVDGQRLYKLANKGETVEREPESITIHEIALLEHDNPDFKIRVRCSKGTYIRALARDIGEEMGTYAAVAELTRTAVGDYTINQAISLDELEHKWSSIAV